MVGLGGDGPMGGSVAVAVASARAVAALLRRMKEGLKIRQNPSPGSRGVL